MIKKMFRKIYWKVYFWINRQKALNWWYNLTKKEQEEKSALADNEMTNYDIDELYHFEQDEIAYKKRKGIEKCEYCDEEVIFEIAAGKVNCPKCNYNQKYDCKEWHNDDENECIECNPEDFGGNWKRIICLFKGHDWEYATSDMGYCQRCLRERGWKGY